MEDANDKTPLQTADIRLYALGCLGFSFLSIRFSFQSYRLMKANKSPKFALGGALFSMIALNIIIDKASHVMAKSVKESESHKKEE